MKALIVYDTLYGNTAEVAEAIADGARSWGVAEAKDVYDVTLGDIAAADIVVVGSPTQGGRPSDEIQQFLSDLPNHVLSGKQVLAFDTHLALRAHGFLLRLVLRIVGFAAPTIARRLQAKGGSLISPPEGFIVHDKSGPLEDGELTRARSWLSSIVASPRQRKQSARFEASHV